MNNENFGGLSEKQRRNKLKFILKEKTQGRLNDAELSSIIDGVKLKRQYIIKLYFDVSSFEKILVQPKMGENKTVLGSVVLGGEKQTGKLKDATKVAAVITRKPYAVSENTIHIYIPPGRKTKAKNSKQQPMVLCDQKCVDEKFICEHIEYRKDILFCDFAPPKEVEKHA